MGVGSSESLCCPSHIITNCFHYIIIKIKLSSNMANMCAVVVSPIFKHSQSVCCSGLSYLQTQPICGLQWSLLSSNTANLWAVVVSPIFKHSQSVCCSGLSYLQTQPICGLQWSLLSSNTANLWAAVVSPISICIYI